jgi:multicomponent Na+:H+ antiporter subunit D
MYFQLVRVVVSFFGVAYVFDTLHFGALLMPLSVLAMFAGSTAAVFQPSLRRLLAYSSIGQVGYLTLALSLGTAQGARGRAAAPGRARRHQDGALPGGRVVHCAGG